MARIRPDSRKSVRSFKGIICVDISEFESSHPSHAVGSPSVVVRNVDLGRVHARPGACGTAAVRLGLSAAHDLHAVHEELGLRRYGGGGEQVAERMREAVIP
jgi:hypothetical protein